MRGLKFSLAAAAALALSSLVAFAPAAQAQSLSASVSARVTGAQTGAGDLATPTFPFDIKFTTALTTGTGSGQAAKVFSDRRTLAASASESLDLAGSLTDAFGATITCGQVKALYVAAVSANTNDVLVGGAASNAFVGPFDASTDSVMVRPGGALLLVAPKTGWTVTAATADLLKVANSSSGTSVTYDIVVVCT